MSGINEFDSGFFTLSDFQGITNLVIGRDQLTEDENLEQLDQEFNALLDTFHARKIVIDLSTVSYLTSAGIGKLISLHRRLQRMDGQLVLCGISPAVSDTLNHSHLLEYFKVASDQESARSILA